MGSSRMVAWPTRSARPKRGFHRALVLVHRVNARHQIAHQKPGHEANQDSQDDVHRICVERELRKGAGACNENRFERNPPAETH